MGKMRRLPAIEKNIKDINQEDFRVKVLGIIVGRDEINNRAMLDDGTGRIVALFADPEQFGSAKEGRRVRIIGKVRKGESSELELEAEILQDMSKLDMGLYGQVKSISEKFHSGG